MKILIVDDNLEFVRILFNEVNAKLNTEIAINTISSDGKEALEYILDNSFDVILLDLQIPNMNGLELLKKVEKLEKKPEIVIMSGDTTLITKVITDEYMVHSILRKPFAIEKLIAILNGIQKKSEIDSDQLHLFVQSVLKKFNFNTNSIGYSYIVDSLHLCIENGEMIFPIEKGLYQAVAQKNKVTNIDTIKWNIRKCLSSMIRYTDTKVLYDFFAHTKKPTPKQFMMRILEYLYEGK